MFFARVALLLSVALSAHALASPHIARAHHHRAISARLVAAEADDAPQPIQLVQPRRLSKRCKPRSSSLAHSTPTPSTTPTSPAQQQPTSASESPVVPPQEHTTSHTHSTTTYEAVPTTTQRSSSHIGSNLPSFLVGTQTGQGTYYATGLGACGITNTDADYIAAVSHLLFDNFPGYDGVNPNSNPVCGKKVKVEYQGKTVTVAITDRCTGCLLTDLDFSPTAFDVLGSPAVGRLFGMQWYWMD
ncbi:hypothetical protein AX15_006677 [Amanita polypyramis BW_CC]|nr:hypothetical protein AX15_006677 [Amanita polypyramis BW_CC]